MRVEVTVTDHIARITLARGDANNALDLRMCRELAQAAEALERDPDARVFVLRAEGAAFSVGGDIDEFVQQSSRIRAHVTEMVDAIHSALLSLRRADAPLLVAVHGVAAGAGLSLVAAADVALSARSARFVSAYTRSGLTPDVGGTWFLPRRIGVTRAFELMASNRTLGAEEAERIGLVTRVVDDEALVRETNRVAEAITALPAAAGSALKALFERSASSTLPEQLEHEKRSVVEQAGHPQTAAALEAFVTARNPRGKLPRP